MAEYENPAILFLEQHPVTSLGDVITYSEFLRSKSGVSSFPPIDLQRIIDRFGMHDLAYVALPHQQGVTVLDCGIPQIIVNETDKHTRQRFTIAHELIETLITEISVGLRKDRLKKTIFGKRVETICQAGAATLLMPKDSFFPKTHRLGVSFQTAELLANEYEVSLIASLFRLVDLFPNQLVVVLWKMKNKPSEIKNQVPDTQMEMPGFHATALPVPKLRVEWSYGNYNNCFIPNHKSIPDHSSVYKPWYDENFTSGEEMIPFGRYNRSAFIESKSILLGGEKHILSLN